MHLKVKFRSTALLAVMMIVAIVSGSGQSGRNVEIDKKGVASVIFNDSTLFRTIAEADSLLFSAYNAHDLSKLKNFFTEDLEFYHDLGGLTNYAQNMEAFKSNFEKNNGLRRELVPGSLEVYPVKGYGAMEIGSHKFCHLENNKLDCGIFKFAMIWKNTKDGWKISRVISYGH